MRYEQTYKKGMVVYKGVEYKSKAEASRQTGISKSVIGNSLEEHKEFPEKTVTISGVTYDTINIAAEKLGVSYNVVWLARKRGTLDRVGLVLGKKNPIIVMGVEYKSLGDFGDAFNLHHNKTKAFIEVCKTIGLDYTKP